MMPKDLRKQNGRWIDVANGNAEYKGHVTKDLQIDDVYEAETPNGIKKMRVSKKEVTTDGYTIITAQEVTA